MSNAFDSVLITFQNDAGNKAEVHNFHFHDSADDHQECDRNRTDFQDAIDDDQSCPHENASSTYTRQTTQQA